MSQVFASIFFTVILGGAAATLAGSLSEALDLFRVKAGTGPAAPSRARRIAVAVRRTAAPQATRAAA